ncbi:MAG TPA: (Fe-S)-binding protein [Candidatus Hydrogenedentes bacterium]|nr:(Fe-S)-binding protein [Candidatus Hydrogenedentota bacterium]HPC17011.1 (Fe-S)-binding protein [Candidatus Hydrogenedentota bacterium]HRT20969.1 (Fe-S)-binding protein [Candidatus Hydrogenedentota bacterium]HRT65798.1 (Fe-S)-binding protein [Candidatus Hydrogenedentota bacterium]
MLTLPEKVVFAVIVAVSLGYFTYRAFVLVRLIRRAGKPDPEDRLHDLGARMTGAAIDVLLQRRTFRKPWIGSLHLLIVWGFFVFAVNTINHFAGAFLPGFNLFGQTFLANIYAATADLFAVLIIAGIAGLAFRRHVLRPDLLTRPSPESAIVFTFIAGAMAAYLCAKATEMALGKLPNAEWHFVASWLARGFAAVGPGPLVVAAHVAWWCDGLMHLALIGLLVIPTKHVHLVAGPFNLLFRRFRPRGQMTTLNLEDENAESFGVSRMAEYSWKQLLDLYACIECGRCQEFCPTHVSKKPLSPKKLVVDLKHHLLSNASPLLRGDETGALVGGPIAADAVWACTTCAACMEHCPMAIEHIDKITDMRRHLVLMESDFPETAATAFRNMETAGNPWGFARNDRAAWADGLEVPVMAEKGGADVLYWVGCSGSYDDRCKNISKAMVRILKAAGVDFAMLGEEERCTCESARRLGNEYLFQMAAREIAETLNTYAFKRILVTCPHCYNTFKNEFPAFGAAYEVVHHAAFIQEMIESGRLNLETNGGPLVAFHDSCYLGRHNGLYDAPRRVLASAGQKMAPVARDREKGFCCGAGGGRMWLEEHLGEPINVLRFNELTAGGADCIAAACPFCITMLSDAAKREGQDTEVLDLAEIVARQLSL